MSFPFLKNIPKKQEVLYVGLVFILSASLNFKLLLWLFERWLALPYGPLGLGIFILGFILLMVRRQLLHQRKNFHIKWLLSSIFLGLLASFSFLIPYRIVQAFILFMSFGTLFFTLFKLSTRSQFAFLGWLAFSLPLVPVLGSSLGLVNREIYTSLLYLFSQNTERIGTSLYTGGYAYHIDASCSGAQGFYLLIGIWFLIHWMTMITLI